MKTLEEKIANIYDIGQTHHREVCIWQEELVKQRRVGNIVDTIILTEHYPVITFGSAPYHNGFSKEFLNEVKKKHGNNSKEKILTTLLDRGIEFHLSNRGGGSSYIGLGQLIVYTIVDHERITGKKFNVSKYKDLIDQIMFKVIKNGFGINAKIVKVAKEMNEPTDPRDRKDVWVQQNGKNYKIGGKGIRFSDNIASHGFSIYVKKDSIKHFDLILPCGYSHDELGVASMEHQLNREINMKEVKEKVLDTIKKVFQYKELIRMNKKEEYVKA